MTINAWKTNFIGLNKPPKILSGVALRVTAMESWPYPNNDDDPYWTNGYNPQPYKWKVEFSVETCSHGSNLTRTPFIFDAQDIETGDFVAGAVDGKVLQIISILAKTNDSLIAVVEDRLRYNTFRDSTGNGIFSSPSNVVFFQINELGFPMIDPIPPTASSQFFSSVTSRFQYMNPLTNYLLEKTNHGFEQGDAICIENENFALANATNIGKFIGTVIHPGPGPHQFILRPANSVIDFVPGLPGLIGDYVYPSTDGTGNLTTNGESRRPIFMKIASSITSSTVGTGRNPNGNDGDIIEINNIRTTLQGTGTGTYNLDDAIQLINSKTSLHKVTAMKVGTANEIISSFANVGGAYGGVVAGYVPFSSSINGVPVTFTTTTSGAAAFGDSTVADVNDIVTDINAANIENIIASTDGTNLILTNTVGEAITIVNITPDSLGNQFAGNNSISSLPEFTVANTSSFSIELERVDGGPLTLVDITGQFFFSSGVMSGQSGRYALGLNIEQGIRSSLTAMVPTLEARNSLRPLPGDQAYVLDTGFGEWAVFVWDGNFWQQYSNQRSDATDAKTLVTTLDIATLSSGSYPIGKISANRKIVDISVEISNGTQQSETDIVTSISTGIASNNSLFTSIYDSILLGNATYHASPNFVTNNYVDAIAVLNKVAGSTGIITIRLTYV